MKPANQTDQVAWKSKSVPSLSKTMPADAALLPLAMLQVQLGSSPPGSAARARGRGSSGGGEAGVGGEVEHHRVGAEQEIQHETEEFRVGGPPAQVVRREAAGGEKARPAPRRCRASQISASWPIAIAFSGSSPCFPGPSEAR